MEDVSLLDGECMYVTAELRRDNINTRNVLYLYSFVRKKIRTQIFIIFLQLDAACSQFLL